MKTLITLIVAFAIAFPAIAQTDSVQVTEPDFENLIKKTDAVNVKEKKDTVHVRLGKHHVEIISGDKKTHIDVEELNEFESKWDDYDFEINEVETIHSKRKRKFDGHWDGIDFGGNFLLDTDYSMYPEGTPDFLLTRPEKSFEFNWNFAEYSFGFGSYVGIVTGLGLNFNDYKFKNRLTIQTDENGLIQPVELPEGDFRKSKLSTVFLTAPLMLEFQIPGNHGQDRLFIAAGLIGGVKLGEHTKTKIGNEKLKDKGDFNISPLRWGYTARIGFEDMGIFATYYNTPLFEEGKGPATTPVTVGLTFSF